MPACVVSSSQAPVYQNLASLPHPPLKGQNLPRKRKKKNPEILKDYSSKISPLKLLSPLLDDNRVNQPRLLNSLLLVAKLLIREGGLQNVVPAPALKT